MKLRKCVIRHELRKKVLGREHPDTIYSMNLSAGVLNSLGKHDEAEEIGCQTL